MRVAIFGAGAVGGYFGARLAESGEDVVFIARGEHLMAIRRGGLKVESLAGDFVLTPVEATDSPHEIGPVDVVLVGVKAWQIDEAAQAMRPLVGDRTIVLPLQNGVEASDRLGTVLGDEHILGGLCYIIAYQVGPGHIRHAGADPTIFMGELSNQTTNRIEGLRDAFARADGVAANIPVDIQAAVWSKFIWLAAWSGIGAVTRSPVGTFRSQPETRELLVQALTETYHVAGARDVELASDSVESSLAILDSQPPERTTSMQRDIAKGRPSELEQQNGAVVRLGKEVNVDTPVNSMIYGSLLPTERRARGLIKFA